MLYAVEFMDLRDRESVNLADEIVWMMDAFTKKVIEVNPAYETITGRSLESIVSDPTSYADLIHPGDREHVLAKLENAVHSGHFDEEFRIVRPDGEVRWVWVKTSRLPRSGAVIRHLVGTAQDITARKMAAAQVAEHLTAAETARAQADAARSEAEAGKPPLRSHRICGWTPFSTLSFAAFSTLFRMTRRA